MIKLNLHRLLSSLLRWLFISFYNSHSWGSQLIHFPDGSQPFLKINNLAPTLYEQFIKNLFLSVELKLTLVLKENSRYPNTVCKKWKVQFHSFANRNLVPLEFWTFWRHFMRVYKTIYDVKKAAFVSHSGTNSKKAVFTTEFLGIN